MWKNAWMLLRPEKCHGDNLKRLAEMPYNNACYFCLRESNGNVGFFHNDFSLKICSFCYEHVLLMRPTDFVWTKEYIEKQITKLQLLSSDTKLALKQYKEKYDSF